MSRVRRLWRFAVRNIDFVIGALTAGACYEATLADPHLLTQATALLASEITIGLAVLATVLAAMAVLVVFMSDAYLVVLRGIKNGIASVVWPYKAVASLGCATALMGIAATLSWDLLPTELQSLLLALTTALTVAALIGTGQLVSVTAIHGVQRAKLLEEMENWRTEAARITRSRTGT
jgi:hypothetical protein